MFRAAVLQMTSTSDAEGNLRAAEALIGRAVDLGAELIVTPENTNYLGPHREKVRLAETIDGPTVRTFAGWAAERRVHLLVGSFNEKSDDSERCFNTSLLFSPTGQLLASYRKIHLFDVDVSDAVRFKESDTVLPGEEAVVAETELGNLGLSICYDLRFGELYRALRAGGAEVLTVPSAFTLTTGKDHWQPLLRTRAIETQCYVLAAAQCGEHDDRGLRESYGHAMIVDPWGDVIAMAPSGPGVAVADIDLDRVAAVRRSMPVESHRRLG